MGLAVLIGFVLTWRGKGGLLHWYTLANIALLVLTPYPRGRYLLPLLPLWAWYWGATCQWLGERVSRPLRLPTGKLGHGLLLASCAAAASFTVLGISQQAVLNWDNRGQASYAPGRYAMGGSDLANYAQATAWVREHAPANSVVVCRKPFGTYWVTGRASTWDPLWAPDSTALWERVRQLEQFGPVYIIQDGFVNRFQGDLTNRTLRPALRQHSNEVSALLTLDKPRTVVWRLAPNR